MPKLTVEGFSTVDVATGVDGVDVGVTVVDVVVAAGGVGVGVLGSVEAWVNPLSVSMSSAAAVCADGE